MLLATVINQNHVSLMRSCLLENSKLKKTYNPVIENLLIHYKNYSEEFSKNNDNKHFFFT